MIKRFFTEPLVHFALLGLAFFFLFNWVNDDDTDKKIIIDQYDLNELVAKWNQQWQRDPNKDELKGLLDSYIKQEIYYREAIGMRLDHNDEVIKRRMAQKMQFLTQDIVDQVEPTEQDLKAFLEDNQNDYRSENIFSFEQVYFSNDSQSDAKSAAILALKKELPEGDPSPIANEFKKITSSRIRSYFGQNFQRSIDSLSLLNHWYGPIRSGYGYHLVKLNELTPSRPYTLDEVREKLVNDYQYNFQQRMNDELFNSLIEKYEIVLEFDQEKI